MPAAKVKTATVAGRGPAIFFGRLGGKYDLNKLGRALIKEHRDQKSFIKAVRAARIEKVAKADEKFIKEVVLFWNAYLDLFHKLSVLARMELEDCQQIIGDNEQILHKGASKALIKKEMTKLDTNLHKAESELDNTLQIHQTILKWLRATEQEAEDVIKKAA